MTLRLAAATASVLLLAGCGGDTLTARAPVVAPTASPAGACAAEPAAAAAPDAACVPFDGEAAMAANEAYRARSAAAPDAVSAATAELSRAEQALERLGAAVPMPTAREVRTALVQAGFPSQQVQAYGAGGSYDEPSESVAVGVDVRGACLVGELRRGVVTLEVVGGYIADGGCVALSGH